MAVLTSKIADKLIEEQGKNIVIPRLYTHIDNLSFYRKNINSVVIPSSVISIGDSAFLYTGLKRVVIGDSVTSIGQGAFSNNNLKEIVIPGSVKSIGYGAFRRNSLKKVVIKKGLQFINDNAFEYNRLKNIEIPDGVITINFGAFRFNELSRVHIPDSVVFIGHDAFDENKFTTITIPDSVVSIHDNAFRDNPLTKATISPDALYSNSAFPAYTKIIRSYNKFTMRTFNADLTEQVRGKTIGPNIVKGTKEDDIIGFGKGRDKLKGGSGNDIFVFSERDKFGRNGADTIIDFDPLEDQILIARKALKGMKKWPKLAKAANRKQLNSLNQKDIDIVYFKPKGYLYYNHNDENKGFGKEGGLFAILKNSPQLNEENIGLLEP